MTRTARRFEVSDRTLQRDLQALMQAGVPVRAIPGRSGGWAIDAETTLPPIHLTAGEASALTAVLAVADATTPYAGEARTAAQKITAAMTGTASAAARELAARIVALPSDADAVTRAAVEQALAGNLVLRLSYPDSAGRESERVVEPAGLLTAGGRADRGTGPAPRPDRTAPRLGRRTRRAAGRLRTLRRLAAAL